MYSASKNVAFEEAFSQYPDVTTHGAVLWSLMKKTMNSAVSGVSGEHFKVCNYLESSSSYLKGVSAVLLSLFGQTCTTQCCKETTGHY
jgi:hypothetical protein